MRAARSLPHGGRRGSPWPRPHLNKDPPPHCTGQRPTWTETPWTETPPGQRPLLDRESPLDRYHPGQGPPWTETPLWTEWQTGVKALPCPRLRLRAVTRRTGPAAILNVTIRGFSRGCYNIQSLKTFWEKLWMEWHTCEQCLRLHNDDCVLKEEFLSFIPTTVCTLEWKSFHRFNT